MIRFIFESECKISSVVLDGLTEILAAGRLRFYRNDKGQRARNELGGGIEEGEEQVAPTGPGD